MFPTPNPLAAAFSGVALPQMVIVRNGRIVPISDVPKPQGEKGEQLPGFYNQEGYYQRTRFGGHVWVKGKPKPPTPTGKTSYSISFFGKRRK